MRHHNRAKTQAMRAFCHLQLESLENRLPLGDALLSGLLSCSFLGSISALNPNRCQFVDVAVGEPRPSLVQDDTVPAQPQPRAVTSTLLPASGDDSIDIPGSDSLENGPETGLTGTLELGNPITANLISFATARTTVENSLVSRAAGESLVLASGFVFHGEQPSQRAGVATRLTDRGTGTLTSELPSPTSTEIGTPAVPDTASVEQSYGRLPLSFEANLGQTDSQVRFLVRAPGYTLFLTGTESVMVLNEYAAPPPGRDHANTGHATSIGVSGQTASAGPERPEVVRMQLAGANPAAAVAGLDELPGKVNYFLGNDPSKWHANVPTYSRVQYQQVYQGIDLVYYGNQNRLEYDFNVAPGADPRLISLRFSGVSQLDVNQGELMLHTTAGVIRQHKPLIYQEVDGVRQEIAGGYLLHGQQVGFQLGDYDRSHPLVIDPVLSYSTYLGGNRDDKGRAVAVDSAGNAYVTGSTTSTNFPTASPFQATYAGGVCGGVPCTNTFLTKLNPTGSGLIYSTYLGGNGNDKGLGLAVDSAGNAYVTGEAGPNFPTTPSAFQRTFAGGDTDAFAAKFNTTGGLVYSTYIGGNFDDSAEGIAVDTSGNAYIVGTTSSTTFPTTAGSFQRALGGAGTAFQASTNAFVAKLNANGSALVYSTYLGGTEDMSGNGFGGRDSGSGIAIDSSGNAYVTGSTNSGNFPIITSSAFQSTLSRDTFGDPTFDGFVTKLDSSGSALLYSSFLGGNGDDFDERVTLDPANNAYIIGSTDSTNLPVRSAFQTTFRGVNSNAFVAKMNLNASGSASLVYLTYLGGSVDDFGADIAVDGQGNAYVTGDTTSTNFPTTPDAPQPSSGAGDDAFVTKLSPAGSALIYSTYLGGSGDDVGHGIAVDASQSVYVTGSTLSTNFPTTAGAFQTASGGGADAFVAKLVDSQPPAASFNVVPSMNPVVAGTAFSLTVTARRPDGSTATDYRGTVHFTSTDVGAQAMLPGNYTFTATDNGRHTFTSEITLVTAGSQTVTATDTVSGSITGNATVTVTPAAAVLLFVAAPDSVSSGVPFDITVIARDPYGNTDTNYLGTVTFSSSDTDPNVVLPADYPFTAADSGMHTFPSQATLITPGPQTITAADTISGIMGTANVTVLGGGFAPAAGDRWNNLSFLSAAQFAFSSRSSLPRLGPQNVDLFFSVYLDETRTSAFVRFKRAMLANFEDRFLLGLTELPVKEAR